MWVWTCPATPDVKNEHHSKQIADILLHNHVAGVNVLGLKPCPLEHELIDDGVPCRFGKMCGTPYVRNYHHQLELFNKTIGKGNKWFWICPGSSNPRNEFLSEEVATQAIKQHESGQPHVGRKPCFYNHVLRKDF